MSRLPMFAGNFSARLIWRHAAIGLCLITLLYVANAKGAASITSVSPTTGSTSGGTPVTISGTGFTGATSVNFGIAPAASFTVFTDTFISCVSPAGAVGTVDVTVTTPLGTSTISAADNFTYANATNTVLSSSLNPAFVGDSVTLTATVTSTGGTPTGTVTFADGGTTLAAGVSLDGSGVATFTSTSLIEGNHSITATYSPTGTFLGSSASLTESLDNHTLNPVTGMYSNPNPNGMTIPGAVTPKVYPSHLFVSGATTNISHMNVGINGFSAQAPGFIQMMLVGPTGAAFCFYSKVPAASVSNLNLVFDDNAAAQATAGTLASGSFMPTNTSASFFGAPAPGVYGVAAPTGSATFASVFGGLDANGKWSVYIWNSGEGAVATSITGSIDLTFDKRPQTIDFSPTTPVNYGTAPITLTGAATSGNTVSYSIVSGPATVSGSTLTITGAGSIVIQADQAGDATFNAAPSVQATIVVNPVPLTVSAVAQSKVYGSTNPALSFTANGFVGTDTAATALTGALSTTATVSSGIGAYPITQGSLSAANYTISFTPANLTVTASPLTITATAQTKVYGSANPALTFTATGLVGTDTIATALTGTPSTTASISSGIGTYPITQGSLTAANYLISFTPANLVVTPAPLVVSAVPQSIKFGAAIPALSFTVTGFVGADTIANSLTGNLTTSASAASPAGIYPITIGTLAAANYTIAFTPANLTIVGPNVPPTIESGPTANPNPAFTGQSVTFSVAATDANGDALTYSWDFGDGSTGTGATVIHTYSTAATYMATVTVSDGAGGIISGSVTETILPAGNILLAHGYLALGRNSGDSATLLALVKIDPSVLKATGNVVTVSIGGLMREITFDGVSSNPNNLNAQIRFTHFNRVATPVMRVMLKITGDLKTALFANQTLNASGHPSNILLQITLNNFYASEVYPITFKQKRSADYGTFGLNQ